MPKNTENAESLPRTRGDDDDSAPNVLKNRLSQNCILIKIQAYIV